MRVIMVIILNWLAGIVVILKIKDKSKKEKVKSKKYKVKSLMEFTRRLQFVIIVETLYQRVCRGARLCA